MTIYWVVKSLLMVINRQFKAKLLYRIPLTSVVGFKSTLNTLKSTRSKSVVPQGTVGSNPTLSARTEKPVISRDHRLFLFCMNPARPACPERTPCPESAEVRSPRK